MNAAATNALATNRFTRLFQDRHKRGAFIPFFVLGDPDAETSLRLIRATLDAGADALELGIAFSDPIADGPIIQAASQRALAHGMDTDRSLNLIARIRERSNVPIGLLIYSNLMFRRGADAFAGQAAAAGVDAILAADLPFDRAGDLSERLARRGLGSVFLISQNTPEARARVILEASGVFSYAVGVMGTTGARDHLSGKTRDMVARLRRLSDRPFVVGFGVSRPEHAAAVIAAGANGVVVGSALIRMIERNLGASEKAEREIKDFIERCREEMRRGEGRIANCE